MQMRLLQRWGPAVSQSNPCSSPRWQVNAPPLLPSRSFQKSRLLPWQGSLRQSLGSMQWRQLLSLARHKPRLKPRIAQVLPSLVWQRRQPLRLAMAQPPSQAWRTHRLQCMPWAQLPRPRLRDRPATTLPQSQPRQATQLRQIQRRTHGLLRPCRQS